jgi:hypothetical protein
VVFRVLFSRIADSRLQTASIVADCFHPGSYQGPGFSRAVKYPLFNSVIPSDRAGANATKRESRNPENVSFTLPFQGVLPILMWHSQGSPEGPILALWG